MIHAPIEPSRGLEDRIIQRLREEAVYLRIRRRFAVLSLLLILSLAVLPFAIFAALEAARISGFFTFASLLFTDTSIALSQWQDVGYSLLESFPVMATLLCAVITAVAVSCLSYLLREYRLVWKHLPSLRVSR